MQTRQTESGMVMACTVPVTGTGEYTGLAHEPGDRIRLAAGTGVGASIVRLQHAR